MYREFFGFTGKPFQLSPDARFFFPSKEHSRALSFLQYGLSQGDGFIVITGDVGTGKTTLVQALLGDLDSAQTVVANVVTTQLQDDDLVNLVAANFGLDAGPTSSKAMLLRDLEQYFIQRAREGRRVLLIVDEAQNLPTRSLEELRMLSNFHYQGQPLLQVFLLGQEEFRTTLLSVGFEQLRQRVIATYHLNPLDEHETRTYVEHRLERVGWRSDPSITEAAFDRIFAFTQGVPRRINNLCDRLMLYTFLEERHDIDEESVRLVAEEIGAEFFVADSRPPPSQTRSSGEYSSGEYGHAEPARDDNGTAGLQQLETVARIMFDKANVQQRIAALERSVDTLGQTLGEELANIRATLDLMREEIRESSDGYQRNETEARKKAS